MSGAHVRLAKSDKGADGAPGIVLTRVAKDGAIPFDLNPNKLTRETLAKSACGEEVHRARDAKDLFDQLGI
jgi:DNA-damage-inducible protein J